MRPTNRRHTTKTDAPSAPQPAEDDPVPENIDEFRTELARRIARFIARPEEILAQLQGAVLPAPARLPRIRCSNAPPLLPSSPDQRARATAEI
jgi:hypothetical protein